MTRRSCRGGCVSADPFESPVQVGDETPCRDDGVPPTGCVPPPGTRSARATPASDDAAILSRWMRVCGPVRVPSPGRGRDDLRTGPTPWADVCVTRLPHQHPLLTRL